MEELIKQKHMAKNSKRKSSIPNPAIKPCRRIIILILIPTFIILGVGFWLFQSGYFRQTPTAWEPPYPEFNTNGDPILSVFEGRIPCADGFGCEMMKVGLVLYISPETKAPTTYWLGFVRVGVGNDRTVMQGLWTIQRGIKGYPEAVVYELDSNTPSELRSYWRVNENILLPLDPDMNPKVGNSAWGYMLSRYDKPYGPRTYK